MSDETEVPLNRDPITTDPIMDEDHLDQALEDSFPASDPLPVGDRT